MTGLFDEKTPIKVKALPNRELLGWIGGARWNNLCTFSVFRPSISNGKENNALIIRKIYTKHFETYYLCNFRLSNLSSFQRFWLTKADYQENGPVIVHDNSKIFEDIKNSNTQLQAAWSQYIEENFIQLIFVNFKSGEAE